MSLSTPTTKEISDNIIAQLEASLNQSIPLLPKAFLRVLSKTLSGVFILLYKYSGFIFLQMFVKTASDQDTEINGVTVNPLKEWGRLVGVGEPTAATKAELKVEITVLNQTGILTANTQLIGPDNGVTYVTLESISLNAATKEVTVRAVSDQSGGSGAGTLGNLSVGEQLSVANPIANVSRTAPVLEQVVTAADAESADVYRQRILDRFQKRPQGGAYADYELWGEEAAGIVNVYPYTSTCPGQVDVYVEATQASSGSPDGIPTTAQLQAVKDLIELDENGLATRRPAGALVNVYAITRAEFSLVVTNLAVENLAAVQADITTAVTEYFSKRAPYIVGLTVPPRLDRITSTGLNGVIEDIVSSAGGTYSGATVSRNGVGITEYTLGSGEKAKLTTISYI